MLDADVLERVSRLGGRSDGAVRARRVALVTLVLTLVLSLTLAVASPPAEPEFGTHASWHPGDAFRTTASEAEEAAFRPVMGALPNITYEAELVARPDVNSGILIVTAFFPLAQSKHSLSEYAYWLQNQFRSISTDILVYTTPEVAELFWAMRGGANGPGLMIDTTYATPFEIPPLAGLEKAYDAQHELDPETYHTAPLYAVWNAKPFLVGLASTRWGRPLRSAVGSGLGSTISSALAKIWPGRTAAPALYRSNVPADRRYDYLFWSDAGAMRRAVGWRHWPDRERVDQMWADVGARDGVDDVDRMAYWPLVHGPPGWALDWNITRGPLDYTMTIGSFFGGPAKAVQLVAERFYTLHAKWLADGFFVGKDQNVFATLLLIWPEDFLVTLGEWPNQKAVHCFGPWGWWWYQAAIASPEEVARDAAPYNALDLGCTADEVRGVAFRFLDFMPAPSAPTARRT